MLLCLYDFGMLFAGWELKYSIGKLIIVKAGAAINIHNVMHIITYIFMLNINYYDHYIHQNLQARLARVYSVLLLVNSKTAIISETKEYI